MHHTRLSVNNHCGTDEWKGKSGGETDANRKSQGKHALPRVFFEFSFFVICLFTDADNSLKFKVQAFNFNWFCRLSNLSTNSQEKIHNLNTQSS